MTWQTWLLVFIGGGTGSVLRFLISWYLPYQEGFPWATFWANVLSCLIMSAFIAILPLLSESMRLFLLTGFCGGLSTFSAFSRETFELLDRGEWALAGVYVLTSLLVGVGILWAGYRVLHVNV